MNIRVLIIFFLCSFCFGQDYSSQWEGHFSYSNISGISINEDKVVASAENAIFSFDTTSEEINKTSTINGLSGEKISYYYYSEVYEMSVIGYENGLIEIVNSSNETTTVVDILNKATIPPNDKRINHIYEYNNLVYLSCDFGISVYDLEQLEFGDTYFIGAGGAQISVKQTTIKDEFIYAATANNGIKRAEHGDGDIIDLVYGLQLVQVLSQIGRQ